MKIPGVYIPEFAKLSPEARKDLVGRCLNSDEVRRLHARVKVATWVGAACLAAAMFPLGLLGLHWTYDLNVAATSFVVMSYVCSLAIFRFFGTHRVLRRQLMKDLEDGSAK